MFEFAELGLLAVALPSCLQLGGWREGGKIGLCLMYRERMREKETEEEDMTSCPSPRLCFLVSRASSVANKVFGKRMKILDLEVKGSGCVCEWCV